MTRKRFVKILMSCGMPRNEAVMYAQLARIIGSYYEALKLMAGRY